jgi:hypothetical protein
MNWRFNRCSMLLRMTRKRLSGIIPLGTLEKEAVIDSAPAVEIIAITHGPREIASCKQSLAHPIIDGSSSQKSTAHHYE